MSKVISKSEGETKKAASEVADYVMKNNCGVVSIKGELGAGKTIFVKGFCEKLNVNESKVKSPTYTYLRRYDAGECAIYHFDYYRVNNPDESLFEELREIMDRKNSIILIEWPEKIGDILPVERAQISLKRGKKINERIININLPK